MEKGINLSLTRSLAEFGKLLDQAKEYLERFYDENADKNIQMEILTGFINEVLNKMFVELMLCPGQVFMKTEYS